MKFEIVSPLKPSGSQPEAITKLADGYGVHQFQTLLGITGSGKSLDYHEALFVRDASGEVMKTTIGGFVEHSLTAPHFKGDTSYQLSQGYSVLSFDPLSGEVAEKPITQVSKHAENKLFEIILDDNSSIKVTANHNCFRFKNGIFELCETRELSLGDFLPLAMHAPPVTQPLAEVALPVAEHEQVVKTSGSGLQLIMYHNVVIPLHIPITEQFLTFCGLYISEGHCTPRSVLISNQNISLQQVCQEFSRSMDVHWYRRNQNDVSYNSTKLSSFMHKNFGNGSSNKYIPSWCFNLSNKQLSVLLRGAFDGDGWVEKTGGVYYLSKSKQLIDDMRYLLLRYNITTRITVKNVNDSQFYQIAITGQRNLRKFVSDIGFSLEYKQERAKFHALRAANTNVDTIPGSGSILLDIRRHFNISQKGLAKQLGVRQSYISLVESGKRNFSQTVFSKLAVWASALDSKYNHLKNLMNFNFRRIIAINEVFSTTGYVYDIAVAGTETFMAGNGGIFVHNTFTMANVIEKIGQPTLVLAHNKTLAAQLYHELKDLFPKNRVEYFVSYYDYYQPESYLPASDTYIEKDAQINAQIEKLRLKATASLMARKDVIIVSSVSCIYGLGDPKSYFDLSVTVKKGMNVKRNDFLKKLVDIQYTREDATPDKGNFRVRGDVVDIYLGYEDTALRVQFFGDEIETIEELDPINMSVLNSIDETMIFPAKHYVITEEQTKNALGAILEELGEQVKVFEDANKMLEAHRINQRTRYDLEMIKNLGYCNGIENYSRYFDQRQAGQPPYCLLDFFPKDFLLIIDESHATIPQVHGMFKGDWSRKANLIEYGFRLPSAHDNRPLKFEEFEKFMQHVIFVSATPAEYERQISGQLVEQIIRPTGLLDPTIEVRQITGQMDDLLGEIHATTDRGNKILVTTLTKRMAEDLTGYMEKAGIRVRYLHSEIETLERTEIIRQLRADRFDVLVGINLLREGLDIPEVELVAILDADKEGFLRTERSLIQTIGRAARNAKGRVLLYADKMTDAMKSAIKITEDRRARQIMYNQEHNITPTTISKSIPEAPGETKLAKNLSGKDVAEQIKIVELEMRMAADQLDFERAIALRDHMNLLQKRLSSFEKKMKE